MACLASEAAGAAHEDFARRSLEADSFDEDLFAYVVAGLRRLKPLRKHLPALLETTLNPFVALPEDDGQSLRTSHLETVARLAKKHGLGELLAVALQLYWTLYTGVLVCWANDKSPKQEDSLALLDHSLEMFVAWLRGQSDESPAKSRKK